MPHDVRGANVNLYVCAVPKPPTLPLTSYSRNSCVRMRNTGIVQGGQLSGLPPVKLCTNAFPLEVDVAPWNIMRALPPF